MWKYALIFIVSAFTIFLLGCEEIDTLMGNDEEKPTAGSIEGKVTLENAEEHGGVSISLAGTDQVVVSKDDGSFQFLNVNKGTHSLVFKIDGFVGVTKEVEVIAGKASYVDVFLQREIPMPPAFPNP